MHRDEAVSSCYLMYAMRCCLTSFLLMNIADVCAVVTVW